MCSDLPRMHHETLQTMTTNHLIENMRTPSILDLAPCAMQKTSKRILNQNALKFKLI